MTAYYVAGKADDPAFAWVETVAHMIAANFPHVTFHMEMKHPDEWKDFVNDVFRKYDFSGLDENYQGPLIWTPEGQLVGRGADFMQHVYAEKFRLQNPPMITEDRFRRIANDNMAQVVSQRQRQQLGPDLATRLEETYAAALAAGALQALEEEYLERRTALLLGVALELRLSGSLGALREARRALGPEGDKSEVVPRMCAVAEIGPERSHRCLLHPRPLAPQHVALVPRRLFADGGEEELRLLPRWLGSASRLDEGLDKDDFLAAAEVLLSGSARACAGLWLGLTEEAGSHLQPVDTHLQVVPQGLCAGAEPPFPTALHAARLLLAANPPPSPSRGGAAEPEAVDFPLLEGAARVLQPVIPLAEVLPGDASFSASELAKALQKAYAQATRRLRRQVESGAGLMLAFTPFWLLLVPLRGPAKASRFEAAVWRRMPPPHACALLGLIVCPAVELSWPEAARLARPAEMVSSRARLEGIPEDAEGFAEADEDVRICLSTLRAAPMEVVKYWTFPAP